MQIPAALVDQGNEIATITASQSARSKRSMVEGPVIWKT
jgi:hypothetical protein